MLPRSLLARSLLIIVIPLILLQVISGLIFWETHWDTILLRLARGVAGDVGAIVRLLPDDKSGPEYRRLQRTAQGSMQMRIRFEKDAILKQTTTTGDGLLEETLIKAMGDFVNRPFFMNSRVDGDQVMLQVQVADGVLEVRTPRKRLFSSSATVFVLWMIGTSLILFAVATVFMRNQVKPIRRLAIAADAFGKGRDVAEFKPEGAREVRQAASAFIAMRERIRRQIAQRTDMLSGVSHDLRTPLTRMKLQLAMLPDDDGKGELSSDVEEMEHMLEGYLAFARGEGGEKPSAMDLAPMITEVAHGIAKRGVMVDHHVEGALTLTARPHALKRAVTNLAENAARYGTHVRINTGVRGDAVEITVDDDGPGIPADQREAMFRPFSRADSSRNPTTGGVGLGLTIARDMVRSHGGDITLDDSPLGGLRARIRLPL